MEVDVILRNWWSYLLRAIVAVVFGILLLGWPAATLKVAIVLIGILMVMDGLAAMIRSALLAGRKEKWGWTLVAGISGILVGAIILGHMEFSLAFVAVLAGIWVVLSGVVEIAIAFEMPPQSGREIVGVVGIISIAFGIVIVAYPFESVYALSVILGIYALIRGGLDIVAAFYTRRLHGMRQKLPSAD
ncbi:MAG: hypothetical protein A2W01_00705 [Candidatus Solincola sediminis]|uniref:HdeD family acid-resistance protein n=1 Tax=Candidatus Solincola sediminis TaxID=1797199 RepID=A0A1F2WI65_9ACTN|nr:MAG: hypothetical protein A2Y75_01110 [Candidatus Solincola sediminis]OFW57202.1 MAG: hypothetical protein A2W01_00705 [Candidatus Solincola sediminis]